MSVLVPPTWIGSPPQTQWDSSLCPLPQPPVCVSTHMTYEGGWLGVWSQLLVYLPGARARWLFSYNSAVLEPLVMPHVCWCHQIFYTKITQSVWPTETSVDRFLLLTFGQAGFLDQLDQTAFLLHWLQQEHHIDHKVSSERRCIIIMPYIIPF